MRGWRQIHFVFAAASLIGAVFIQATALAQGVSPPGVAPGYCGACLPVVEGVDCLNSNGRREARWHSWGPIPWEAFAQGEYVGPPRAAHLPEYRLRPDDQVEFVFRHKREELSQPYRLEVGDTVKIESLIDEKLNRELTIQPDGTVDLLLVGPVRIVKNTVGEAAREINKRYEKYYKITDVNVARVKTQTRVDDILQAINNRFSAGGQSKSVRVTPEGTVSLPTIGVMCVQGLTLDEVRLEVEARYRQEVSGLEVTPILAARAPRFIYVVGEVRTPGRFELLGPTTAMQSIALAGGTNVGGNLRQIVVFRRAEDWRLLATKLDIRGGLYGERPAPADEIWLRDMDLVIVPKAPIQRLDDFVETVFTKGVYGAFPMGYSYQFGGSVGP